MYGGQQNRVPDDGGYGAQQSIDHADAAMFAGQQAQYGQPQHAQQPARQQLHQQRQQAPPRKEMMGDDVERQPQNLPPPPQIDPKDLTFSSSPKCQDPIWIFLFFGNIAFFIYMAVTFVPKITSNYQPVSSDFSYTLFAGAVALAAAISGILSYVWLKLMHCIGGKVIKAGIIFNVLFTFLLAFLYLFTYPFASIFWFLLGALMIMYYRAVRPRIPFSEAILQASVQVEYDNCALILTSTLMTIIGIGAGIVWIYTWSGYVYYVNEERRFDPPNAYGFIYFLLFLSYFWTMEVVRNIIHTTSAGAAAGWWLTPQGKSNVCGAFRRTLTTSFGSICFGSLIVAFLKALRVLLYQAKVNALNNQNGCALCVLCIADCILIQIEFLMQYFNKWAYTYVAIYGKSFTESAKDTWTLFKSRGWDLIINDNLTGVALGLGMFIVAMISGGFASLLRFAAIENECTDPNCGWILFIFGFIAGAAVSGIIMSIVDSAVATTFVLWAEDPAALKANRPAYFENIRAKAASLYPELSSFHNV